MAVDILLAKVSDFGMDTIQLCGLLCWEERFEQKTLQVLCLIAKTGNLHLFHAWYSIIYDVVIVVSGCNKMISLNKEGTNVVVIDSASNHMREKYMERTVFQQFLLPIKHFLMDMWYNTQKH